MLRRTLGMGAGLIVIFLLPHPAQAGTPETPQAPTAAESAAIARATSDSLQEQLRAAELELRRLQGAVRRLRTDRLHPNLDHQIEQPLNVESLLDLQKVIARYLGALSVNVDPGVEATSAEARESPGHWLPALTPAYAGRTYTARRYDTITLQPSVAVSVAHQYGDIVVEPADGCEAEIWQRISLRWNGQDAVAVQAYLAALGIEAQTHDDSVLFHVTRPAARPASIARLSQDLTVRIPEGHAISVSSQYGDVVIRELEAPVNAAAGFGDIDVIGTTGPLVIRAQNGDVLVRRHEGSVTLDHAIGSVGIQETTGPLQFTGRFSDAWLNNVDGACQLTTRGGSVIATGMSGGPLTVDGVRTELDIRGASETVHLSSDQADVRVEGIAGEGVLEVQNGRLQISRCEGAITVKGQRLALRVEDPTGKLRITNRDGDVVIDARQVETVPDVYAQTARGAIAMYMPVAASADVHAVARRGDVLTDMPLTINRLSGQVLAQGRLGDGQSSVVLETDGGRVFVYSPQGLSRLVGGGHRPRLRTRVKEKEKRMDPPDVQEVVTPAIAPR